MLDVLPILTWLAAMTSAVLLALLWRFEELRRHTAVILLCWFLLAAYFQFLAGSVILGTVGLVLQTLLAIYLSVRWRLAG